MIHFFPFGGKAVGRLAVLLLVFLTGLGLGPQGAWASHIRAGDIQAKPDTVTNNPRRIFFKMVLYTDNSSNVDQPKATFFFGDGTSTCLDGVDRKVKRVVPGSPDTSVNTYEFEHIFQTTGSFVVSFIGENRNAGVLNMSTSANQSFYISTRVTIDPSLGLNHSPVLTAPAVDKAATNQVFLHNPAAYDADGDSLAFRLRSSQSVAMSIASVVGPPCANATGTNQPVAAPVPNFRYPNDPAIAPNPVQVAYGGVPVGVPGNPAIFVQDARTGQITWNAPLQVGFYNVAMVVEEWRRTPLGRRLIGEVIRDMQIIVSATTNLRPTLTIPADICVIAGQTVTGAVTATDGSSAGSTPTPVTLFAYSGILPPATFGQSQSGPPTARGTFTWNTDCRNVAELPYLVVFKAQDNPTPQTAANPPLIDEKTWRITVVGPPPQNLQATPIPATCGTLNTVALTWNPYVCANAAHIYVYRKLGSSSFVPGPCDTGIPASAGYTLVKQLPPTATGFTDDNAGLGLNAGQTYCYRIYADFPLPSGGASIASQEACASLPGRGAMLKKVDVETTSTTAGQINVCWTQPRTLVCSTNGTLSYALSRGEGIAPATFTLVANIASLTDTCYVDNGLNTQDKQYTYKLEVVRTFPAGDNRAPVREAAPTASSVRVSALPTDASARTITVSWTYNVPWDNSAVPAVIYRRVGNGAFTRLATAPTSAAGGTYLDYDATLRKGETYCYYVVTEGKYAAIAYLNSLLNRSQQRCLVLNSPPCTPVLALQTTNCDSLAALPEFPGLNQRYTNRLRWTLGNTPAGCDATVANYEVYYRPTPTGRLTLLGTTTQTSYLHANLDFSGGCYAVRAIAPSGIASDTSNVACQDNCVFFRLPNIFTPNGDGTNDTFRPKKNSPVRSIHFQAFNRWGVKVFENTTTASDRVLINWDGGGPVGESGAGAAKVSDGIYYYLAQVEFADFANTKRTYKGWVEVVR
ncbi:T9SS type B sorting domain-containing protein [Hymenobacter rubidus]|uniref:T9SS type B sorting domain-containing protein n=1 Tax=Hymenobacter rubidus TaxID=1441626 RepID=UPI00191CECDD|nr:gliding motility-associated C-terminal domain-containing protein [Hymenobacter rubidus]